VPLHPIANLLLGEAEIVRWRINRLRSPNLDDHDLSDSVLRTSFCVEGEQFVDEAEAPCCSTPRFMSAVRIAMDPSPRSDEPRRAHILKRS
jgi:hypothetical protein